MRTALSLNPINLKTKTSGIYINSSQSAVEAVDLQAIHSCKLLTVRHPRVLQRSYKHHSSHE